MKYAEARKCQKEREMLWGIKYVFDRKELKNLFKEVIGVKKGFWLRMTLVGNDEEKILEFGLNILKNY